MYKIEMVVDKLWIILSSYNEQIVRIVNKL